MSERKIVILSGPLAGRSFPLQTRLLAGRGPENDIDLDDKHVSRQHAAFESGERGVVVRDLGSGNGTFVGKRRVKEALLSDGDVVRVGSVDVRYEETEPVESPLGGTVDLEQRPDGGDSDVRLSEEESNVRHASDAESVYQTFLAGPRDSVSAAELRVAQQRLQALYQAGEVISRERDINKVFSHVMDELFSLVPAQNGAILLRDGRDGELRPAYRRSLEAEGDLTISTTIVQRALEGDAVITANAADDARFEGGASIIAQNISSAMCTPMRHRGEALGVIYVDTRGTTRAFDETDLQLLVALAATAATAIRNAQYVEELKESYRYTLTSLANAVELRDHYTVGHTWRVTRFAMEIARELGWNQAQLHMCEWGGLLHDVGKIAVDDSILRKPGGLDDGEFAKMRVHPERGARLMSDVPILKPVIPYCLAHHEKYDGTGYPLGLKGEDIPIEGRIIAVADAFDAMTSNRPYRRGLDPEEAVARIRQGSGTQFDPVCADAFIASYRDGRIQRVIQDYLKRDGKSIACPFCSTYIPVPEGAEEEAVFQCGVCRRHVRLQVENEAPYGELVAETDVT